jgi:hypothetical protein
MVYSVYERNLAIQFGRALIQNECLQADRALNSTVDTFLINFDHWQLRSIMKEKNKYHQNDNHQNGQILG